MIIGITGTIGAGKGTVVEYLKKKGFTHYSGRAFFIEEIERRGLPINRDVMTEVANDLRAKFGAGYVLESLYKRAQEHGDTKVIIESIRTKGEVEALRTLPHSYLLAVDADINLRYKRISERKSELDYVSFEKFQADETREMSSDEPNKQNLSYVLSQADFVLTNNGTLADLHAQIEQVLKRIQENQS